MAKKDIDFASASVEAPRRPMPRLLLISILFAHLPTATSSPTSCPYGFTGPDCAVKTCRLGCSGHGLCVDGVCYCDPFYAGDGCQTAVHDCSFRGIYNPVLAKCECDAGYIGAECHLWTRAARPTARSTSSGSRRCAPAAASASTACATARPTPTASRARSRSAR